MKWLRRFGLITAATLCMGLQGFQEPTGTATCNNYKANAHKCACGRAKMCGRDGHGSGDPDAYLEGPQKCQKACRKDLCKCLSPCTSRH